MRPGPRRARSGFTLIETSIAIVLLLAVWYGLALAIGAGQRSERAVSTIADANEELAGACRGMLDELRSSGDATIAVADLADGNHELRFQQPIDVGGALAWGVFDRTLGADPAEQNREGWSLRYTVRVVAGDGGPVRQLVRQVLDEALAVQSERVVLEGLRAGGDDPPGLRMESVGDVWELAVATVDGVGGRHGWRQVFHVRTRN